ncbi:hypothetical protein BC830DRAFT_417131 [Chytriomyces sp. MP71]|nr:hypothetical protein BC830DRAFT_417131 [Chytriomyces sp. MP71]
MMLHQLDHSNHMPTATTASTTTVATTGATTDNTINNTINPIDPNQPLSQISQLSHHHHHQQKGALAAAKADQARADTVSQPVLPLSLSLANHAAAAAASPLPLADADMPSQQSQQYQSENNNIPVLTVGPENSLQVISISNPLDPAVPIVYALESSASVHQHLQLQQQQQQQQLQKTHQLPPQALSTSSSSASLAASASVCTEPVQAYAKIEGRDFTYFVRKLTITLGRKIAQDDGVDVHLGSVKSISRQVRKWPCSILFFCRNSLRVFALFAVRIAWISSRKGWMSGMAQNRMVALSEEAESFFCRVHVQFDDSEKPDDPPLTQLHDFQINPNRIAKTARQDPI